MGTSTGGISLYDLRMIRLYQFKDQGFGLSVKSSIWPGSNLSGLRKRSATVASDAATGPSDVGNMVPSADAKSFKVWFRDRRKGSNDLPSLLTKFIDQAELERLNIDQLVGTALLRPYTHGFLVSLFRYEKTRLLASPIAYADARKRAFRARVKKEAESRIRSGGRPARALKWGGERQRQSGSGGEACGEGGEGVEKEGEDGWWFGDVCATAAATGEEPSVLADGRCRELFANPEYRVDVESRGLAISLCLRRPRCNAKRSKAVRADPSDRERDNEDDSDGFEDDDERIAAR
ncbi:hypothetical protein CF327_g1445 [Tilletia walkeri]|nr:hypothetical protein CF327_g1445 [Tilletia walkeri]